MKTCGIFTVHKHDVQTTFSQPLHFLPFGDIHRDSDAFSHDYWTRFLHHARALKNAVFLCMGDATDAISTSEKVAIRGLHDTTVKNLEKGNRKVVEKLAKELVFMKGRMLGVLGGNHFMEYSDGTTSDQYLAHLLDTRFLGVCAFIRLSLNYNSSRQAIDIFAHHGKGGGGYTPGAPFNTVEKMLAGADADIYLQGHDHSRGVLPSRPRLRLQHTNSGLRIRERTPWLGRTGSFLRAYEPGKSSYVVDSCGAPASLGWIEFVLTGRCPNNGDGLPGKDRYIEIKGIS